MARMKTYRSSNAKIISQNDANEGVRFTPQNITTEQDLVSYLKGLSPFLQKTIYLRLLRYYPGSNATNNPDAVDYATLGYTGPKF